MPKRSAAQLSREIAAALAPSPVASASVQVLFGWRPKLEEVMLDLREGRVSRSQGKPLIVSRLDAPRGGLMIIDGYHRAVEAILAGRRSVDFEIDPFVPRIERAGGAHRHYVDDKVGLVDFVRRSKA